MTKSLWPWFLGRARPSVQRACCLIRPVARRVCATRVFRSYASYKESDPRGPASLKRRLSLDVEPCCMNRFTAYIFIAPRIWRECCKLIWPKASKRPCTSLA